MKMYLNVIFVCLMLMSAAFAVEKMAKKKTVFIKEMKKVELFDVSSFAVSIVPKLESTIISESQGLVEQIHVTLGEVVKQNRPLITIKNSDPAFDFRPVIHRSSIDGVVTQIYVNLKNSVSKGSILARISDLTSIKGIFEVSNSDVSKLRAGLAGKLGNRGEDGTIPVTLHAIAPIVDRATGTASAELSFDNPKDLASVSVGKIYQVSFYNNRHLGLAVPEDAVVYRGKDTVVCKVVDNKISYLKVKLGEKRQSGIELLEGVNEGDVVVVRSSDYLKENDIVIATEEK